MTTTADPELSAPDVVTAGRAVYMDCNATAPVDPEVLKDVLRFTAEEYGNAGSRTHVYGQTAKERVNLAREQIAEVVRSRPDEVVFTSGATESDNMALLGLAPYGERTGRKHIVSTAIEHKAVLEPLETLQRRGFEITLVPPTRGGYVEPAALATALRPDTLAVSVMAVNNETGVTQPILEIIEILADHGAYLHVDGAQAYGKDLDILRHQRIDLISVSGHKIYAPKGIGALITRRRGFKRPPLEPLVYGGGQERGLRPGTLPVALVAGLGTASRLALRDHEKRAEYNKAFKLGLLAAFAPLAPEINGAPAQTASNAINFSIPGIDAEAAMVALKDLIAISNGSACTSHSYDPSHVLVAMSLPKQRVDGALRISWSHLTPTPDWTPVISRLGQLRS